MRLISIAVLVASLALVGCKGDPSKPEYWQKAISGGKVKKDRQKAIEELRSGKRMNASFLPMLHGLLASEKHAEVKKDLARLIGEQKDPSSVEPLTTALDMGNPDREGQALNKEIANALTAIGDKKAIPTLKKLAKMRDPFTQVEAVDGLGALQATEAVDDLMELASNEATEAFITKKAIIALGNIGDPKAVPVLVNMMFKERKGISFYVESSFSLYQIGAPAADALLPVVTGEDKKLLAWAEQNRVLEAALFAKAAQVLGDLLDARAEKPLLARLGYENQMLDVKLFVRMRTADALGRLRSGAAVKPLSGMLGEEETNARAEYIRALQRIGGRDAIPALVKSAAAGSWDGREPSMAAIAMLGDGSDLAAFDKFTKEEEKQTLAECKSNPDFKGCDKPADLVKEHLASIAKMKANLEVAKGCGKDLGCWGEKLKDAKAAPEVRERAALELGRAGKGEHLTLLASLLKESNLDLRLAIIQSAQWILHANPDVRAKAKELAPALAEQIAQEKGKTEFVKVNEDLRRLLVSFNRGS